MISRMNAITGWEKETIDSVILFVTAENLYLEVWYTGIELKNTFMMCFEYVFLYVTRETGV